MRIVAVRRIDRAVRSSAYNTGQQLVRDKNSVACIDLGSMQLVKPNMTDLDHSLVSYVVLIALTFAP